MSSATEQGHAPVESEGLDSETPPVGEEIHLPGPSIIPFAMAIGITATVVGTTIDWIWSVSGLIIFLTTLVMWIRDTRRDVEALPEEHH
jgi:hypothetical protein